jgi:heme exporter protein C
MKEKGEGALDMVLGAALAAGMVLALYMAFLGAPRERTMGDLQRIFYFHVPGGITAMTAFAVNFLGSVMFLARRTPAWDALALASAEVGAMLLSINLVTGPIWAKPVWFVWWTWSPRLTLTLVLWILYVAYLLVRNYVADPERRAAIAAVFGIVAFADVPLVWFSIRWWRDQHPSPMLETGGLSPEMWPAFLTCLAVFHLLLFYLVRRRMALEIVRHDLEELVRAAERVP